MMYQEVEGNLITLALEGEFDIITHGCNCFCTMGAGIAPQMAKAFYADLFQKEQKCYIGDVNKLGTIDSESFDIVRVNGNLQAFSPHHGLVNDGQKLYRLRVINSYTQFHYGRYHLDGISSPLDYEAMALCFRKINYTYKGQHIGLPQIGAGLAGGDWIKIKEIIQQELKDMKVTVVIFKP